MEDLIAYAPLVFDEHEPSPPSPPLPLAPAEDPAPIEYGTMHTRVYSPKSSPKSPALKPDRMQDFAPTLPTRTDYALHLAARRTGGGTGSVSSTASTPRVELSPATKEVPLPAAVDLASPGTEGLPPAPPPASEKRRSAQLRAAAVAASVGHAHATEASQGGSSPRRSLSAAFTVEGDAGEHWTAIGTTSDDDKKRGPVS